MTKPMPIDKRRARRAFGRAASEYDRVAVLQREVADRLLERLDYIRLAPQRVLDLGAGTGYASEGLLKRYPKAQVLALDFALPMLQRARRRGRWLRRPLPLCADAEHLPLADASCDLVFSSLTLQWCNDLRQTFQELLRVLRPGGLLMFASFGPDTLQELRAAWAAVDGDAHVSPFLDLHDVGDALLGAGGRDTVMDAERLTLTYADTDALMRDLKTLGAQNATEGRRRGCTGKARLQAMRDAYEQFRADDRLPASYEVVYGHAWAPEPGALEGAVAIPLERIGRARPRS